MSARLPISALIFMMVQAVLFGVGVVIVLATPLSDSVMRLLPWVVGVAAAFAITVSWIIAPRLRARFWFPAATCA